MSDDKIFDDTSGGEKPATQTEDVDSKIAGAVERALGAMRPIFEAIDTRLASVEAGGKTANDAVTEPEAEMSNDISDFVSNPQDFLEKHNNSAINKHVAPVMEMWAADKQEQLEATKRGEIDGKYGEGTYDKEIKPDLDQVLTQLPTAMRSSGKHFSSAVDAIIGRKYDTLREAETTASTEREEAMRKDPNMLPAGRPRPSSSTELSKDAKVFASEWEHHTGEKLDHKEFMADAARGDTEEDWLPIIDAAAKGAA